MHFFYDSLSNVESFSLSNELSVSLVSKPNSNLISICLAVGTGTSLETEEDNGIAHMATHMHILGTKERTAKDISTSIEADGCEIQFFVHPEKTEYYLHLTKDNLLKNLEILSDAVLGPVFSKSVLMREQTVIEQEIVERRDNPFVWGMDLLNKASFPDQGYGMCPLGSIQSMYGLTIDMLEKHHDKFFYPKNMSIGVCGGIEKTLLLSLLEQTFGKYEQKDGQSSAKRVSPRFTPKASFEIKNTQNELAHIFLALPLSENSKEVYAAQIISKILGCGTSSRFFQGLRQERALGYTMGSRVESFAGRSFLKFYFSGWKKKESYNLLAQGVEIIRSLPSTLLEREVQSGINKVLYDITMACENPVVCSGALAEQGLYEGSPNGMVEFIQDFKQSSFEDVRRYSKEIFSRQPAASFVGNYTPLSYTELVSFLHGMGVKKDRAA